MGEDLEALFRRLEDDPALPPAPEVAVPHAQPGGGEHSSSDSSSDASGARPEVVEALFGPSSDEEAR